MIPVLTPSSLNITRHFQHPISILEAITSMLGAPHNTAELPTLHFYNLGFATMSEAFNMDKHTTSKHTPKPCHRELCYHDTLWLYMPNTAQINML